MNMYSIYTEAQKRYCLSSVVRKAVETKSISAYRMRHLVEA